ncbi:MAG TPA: hypothetical protein VGD10_05315 [Allosphingosinicella sp.]|uniref:hypothetical protein n=1 Tax=Allosphingosinicella sp. TaxID=2823234 RepID=UPI002EDB8AE9
MSHRWSALIGLTAITTPAVAADYLTEVTSQVYQTPGTPKEIATRAQTCIAQNLRPGTGNAPQIVSSDLDNGIIVAQSALEVGSFPVWKLRSRFTFEAREGRFRITQTGLEWFNDTGTGVWLGIGKWWGSPWKKAEAAYAASADAVAQCVIAGPKKDVW